METLAIVVGLGVMAIAIGIAICWKIEKQAAINRLKLRHRSC